MTPTQGRKPRTEAPLRVKFRCGLVSRFTYSASQMRWSDTGSDWDIVACERAQIQPGGQ
jgi:hypothetical protein